MKYENVKIGQRVQAKVDIYQMPDYKDKGDLLVEKGTLGEVVAIDPYYYTLSVEVKWDEVVDTTCGDEWRCNHKDIRKVKVSKVIKEGVPHNEIVPHSKIVVGSKVKLIKTDITDKKFVYCMGFMLKVGEVGEVNDILDRQVTAVRIGDYTYAIDGLELVKEGD